MWRRARTQVLIDDDGNELEIKKFARKKHQPRQKKQKKMRPVRSMTSIGEAMRLSRENPVCAAIFELSSNPNLVHVTNELYRLQNRVVNGQKLSARSQRWLAEQAEYLEALLTNPPVMTDDDRWVLDLAEERVRQDRNASLNFVAETILKAWRHQGWVSSESMACLRAQLRDEIEALKNPRFSKNDLVAIVTRPSARAGDDKYELAIVATNPKLEHRARDPRFIVTYGVVSLEKDGRVTWAREERMFLKQKYACVQDT